MLQSMRSFTKSWFATFMLAFIAIPFVIWGIGPTFTASGSTWVAKIGSTAIDGSVFSREYRNEMRRAANAQMTPEQIRKSVLPGKVLDRLIGNTAIYNYAAQKNVTASDAMVSREIQSAEGFRGLSGTFDRATYLQRLNDYGYSDAEFTKLVRNDLAANQLRHAAADGLNPPVGYVMALAGYITEARTVDYVVLTPAMAGTIAAPDDATLAAYVKAHVGRFSTPEYRSVTYAVIGPEDVQGSLKVTDRQLQDEYKSRRAEFNVAETREADQISFLTQAQASAARARINTPADFDALAKARKLTPKTLSIGSVTKDQISEKERADAIFSLAVGQISQPVKGPFGYVLVRVNKITPAIFKPFDSVKADLEKSVKARLAAEAIGEVYNKFKTAEDSGDDIAEAGRQSGMRVITVAAVDHNGLAPDGSKANVGGKQFLDQVFGAEIGEDGDPFATDDGHYYALKVSGSQPPHPRPLESVRQAALDSWMRDARQKAMLAKARDVAARADADGSLNGVAASLGATLQKSGRLERAGPNATFSADFLRGLFMRKAGVSVYGPLARGEGYVIARTTGISHTRMNLGDPAYRQLMYELAQSIGVDIADALANAEKSRQGVQVDQKKFDQAVGGETG